MNYVRKQQLDYWWLVRATYVVDGLFFGHFFLEGGGDSAHTCESRVGAIHVWRHSHVGGIHVCPLRGGHSRVGAIQVWRAFTCVTCGGAFTCGGGIHV